MLPGLMSRCRTPRRVGVVDRVADVQEPPQQLVQLQRPPARVGLQAVVGVEAVDGLLEVVAADEPHGVEGPAVAVGPQPVDRDDARVLQPAGDLGLQQEPLAAGRVVGVRVEDLLEGHLAVQLGVQGDEDGAQAAAGMRPEDAEPLAVGGGRADGVAGRAVGVAVVLGRARSDLGERGLDVGDRRSAARHSRVDRPTPIAARLRSVSLPWRLRCSMTSPSTRVTQGAESTPCSARISAMGRSLAWVQAWKAATSWAWLIRPVWSASNPKSRSREGSRGRGMIVSSPASYLRRTILARPHTGFREKKWRSVALIVTMCRPDCGGAFFRGGFSVGEPKAPRCVLVREAAGGCNSSRVVILGAAKERRGLPGIPRARSGTDLMTSSQEAPRGRRWTRWLAISALAGLIALAAGVLALPRIVDFPWVQRQLLVQANRLLAPGGVRFDHLRVSWSRPTEIEGLVLRDPQGDDIVTAPRAHFSMNLWEILLTRPAAATLTLDAAAVDIERSGDGKVDLLETLKPILSDRPKHTLLIRIADGKLRFHQEGLDPPVVADRAEIDLDLNAYPQPIAWNMKLASASRGTRAKGRSSSRET